MPDNKIFQLINIGFDFQDMIKYQKSYTGTFGTLKKRNIWKLQGAQP